MSTHKVPRQKEGDNGLDRLVDDEVANFYVQQAAVLRAIKRGLTEEQAIEFYGSLPPSIGDT